MGWREDLEQNALVQYMNDVGGRIRYGVPTSQKEAMALTGQIPGARPENLRTPEGEDVEQRRASAYLFARTYPDLAPVVQKGVNWVRSGDAPEVLKVAEEASAKGLEDADKIRAQQQAQARQSALAMARQYLMNKFGASPYGPAMGGRR